MSGGPITIAIYEGQVKIAEKTYSDARRAIYAFESAICPHWFLQPLWKTARGERVPMLNDEGHDK